MPTKFIETQGILKAKASSHFAAGATYLLISECQVTCGVNVSVFENVHYSTYALVVLGPAGFTL